MRPLLMALLLLTSACGLEGRPGATATPDATTPRPTATATPEPSPTASPTPTPAPTRAAAPTEDPACRNSTDTDCGAFRFDPEPDDEPVEVHVKISPAAPKVGDTVTFTIVAVDPDSRDVQLGTYEFTEQGPGAVGSDDLGTCPPAFGPWDPPDAEGGRLERELRHTYREAGTYEATFTVFTHSYSRDDHSWPSEPPGDSDGRCRDPLRSSGKADVEVVVS